MHSTTSADPSGAVVALRGVVKEFRGLRANDGVDFELRRGEVHALLGENGAGKTTLMNILAGLYRPDEGQIWVDGESVTFRSPRHAIERGIGMVPQHFHLVDRFTVAENITLGWHEPRMIIKRQALEARTSELASEYDMEIAPDRPVWQLSVGERQRVEILKSLYRGAEILILDEPTAVLTPPESAALLAGLRRMAGEGRSIVFISHKLKEVLAVADRITVLRKGANVATMDAAGADEKTLARLMIGEEVERVRPTPRRDDSAPEILVLEGVSALGDRGDRALQDIRLSVRAGELLGVAGVAGNGQRELAEVIVGARPVRSGTIRYKGRDISSWSVPRRIEHGIAFTPEDRLRAGVAGALSITDNLIAKRYKRAPVGRRGLLRPGAAARTARRLRDEHDIRGAALSAPVASLSGGNVQKVVLAREISSDPSLLVAANPTRGLDVRAVDATHRLLLQLRDAGKAVLLITEDLDELLRLSDRVSVIYEGRILQTLVADEADREKIGLLMAGRVGG